MSESKRTFESEHAKQVPVYMHDNQASGEEAALEFMFNEEATWSTWVTKEDAGASKKAL